MKAGGPYTLTVRGSSTVQFDDVMIGEVWLCSGQSNMEMGISMARDGKQEIAAADYPGIRLLKVTRKWTPEPQNDIEGAWKPCSPKTVAEGGWGGFSAAGYYFGRELHKKLGVAVGLIDATWGGTRIESWTPPEGFAAVPALKQRVQARATGRPACRGPSAASGAGIAGDGTVAGVRAAGAGPAHDGAADAHLSRGAAAAA